MVHSGVLYISERRRRPPPQKKVAGPGVTYLPYPLLSVGLVKSNKLINLVM